MASEDLLFKTPLNTSHPVNLTFGAEDAAPVQNLSATWVSQIPRPTLNGQLAVIVGAAWTSAIPKPVLAGVALYDNAVIRGVAHATRNAWTPSDVTGSTRQVTARDAVALSAVVRSPYDKTVPLHAALVTRYDSDIPLARASVVTWGECLSVSRSTSVVYQYNLVVPRWRDTSWQTTTPVSASPVTKWQDHIRTRRDLVAPWSESLSVPKTSGHASGSTTAVYSQRRTPWQLTIHPQPGKELVIPVIPPQVCYTPPLGNAVHFLFETPVYATNDANLLFRCAIYDPPPGATKVVPVSKAYIVINDTHLRRADDSTEIPTFGMSMSIDMDSWTWQFSAEMHAQDIAKVMPDISGAPAKLRVTINGNDFFVLAEDIAKTRGFASTKIKVSGRGHSAVLDDPYSPVKTFGNTAARTAQQLMNDALTVNSTPIGWTVDWQLTDWLVPAGAWSHQGTYASAVKTIAKAAGGFIHPDALTQTLHVKKRFNVAPWERAGATPDIQLPSSAVVNEGVAWKTKAPYNSVYVSGADTNGVLINVVRNGSAGDVPAPMIVDNLITHVDAARQAGIAVLADTGHIAEYSLSLPVLASSGIILPGMLMQYDDAVSVRGVVKGVSIAVGEKTVRQSVLVETRTE